MRSRTGLPRGCVQREAEAEGGVKGDSSASGPSGRTGDAAVDPGGRLRSECVRFSGDGAGGTHERRGPGGDCGKQRDRLQLCGARTRRPDRVGPTGVRAGPAGASGFSSVGRRITAPALQSVLRVKFVE